MDNHHEILNQSFQELIVELKDKVQNGDLSSTKFLLKHKTLPDSCLTHDLLKLALINGHSDIFFELVKYGATILDSTQTRQDTLLHYAAKLKEEKPVEFLMKHNVDLCLTNDKNETPLHAAARNVNKNILNILLKQFMKSDHGYQNIVDSDGISIFHILCMGSNSNYVSCFLKDSQISINDTVLSSSKVFPGYSPLHFAFAYSRIATVKILLKHGANLNAKTSNNLSMLHLVCNFSEIQWMIYEARALAESQVIYQEILKQKLEIKCADRLRVLDVLFENKCNVKDRDKDGNNPLMYAVLSNRECIYQVYKDLKYSVLSFSVLSIEECIVSCQLKTIEKILDYYVSLTVPLNQKPLDEAKDIFKKKKQLINFTNNFGSTCLHHVAATKYLDPTHPMNTDVIKFLLKSGADLNVYNINFSTPLHLASKNDSYAFVKSLLEFNMNILKHKNGQLPDRNNGELDSINSLLYDINAFGTMMNIDAQDNAGNTPLYYAYMATGLTKRDTCFEVLLQYGADLSIENESGKTTLGIVCEDIIEKVTHEIFPVIIDAYKKMRERNCMDSLREFLEIKDLASEQGISVQFLSNLWMHLKVLESCNVYSDRLNNKLMEKIDAVIHISDEIISLMEIYSSECRSEVDRMKMIKLNNMVTLHDVLYKNINKVALYTNNDILRQILESPQLAAVLPKYEKLLIARYVRALARSELLGSAMASLKSIINLDMPDLCLEKMLSFLNEKKLRDIIEVGRLFKRKSLNSAMTEICEPLQKMVKIS